MQAAYSLGGTKWTIKKYKVNATHANGIILLAPDATVSGLITSTTTSWANSMGLQVDQNLSAGAVVSYSTTQGDPEAVYSVIIDPDLVMRALLVSDASNTALLASTVDTADSSGLTANGDKSYSNCDGGLVWYTSGPNVGNSRKIESVSTATVTVLVPFAANVVGDTFHALAAFPGLLGATMSTNLLNIIHDNTALGSDAAARYVDFELNGASNSYAHVMQNDNVFQQTT